MLIPTHDAGRDLGATIKVLRLEESRSAKANMIPGKHVLNQALLVTWTLAYFKR